MMSAGYSLRSRVPGQSVMSRVIESQKLVPARSRIARIFGFSPLSVENRALYRAAVGESLVGEALDHLGPEWDVLHDVPIDEHYEIDHLAIGPSGVFVVMTKNFPGHEIAVAKGIITVGGKEQDHVEIARAEAAGVTELLSAAAGGAVRVQSLVVVVNPKKLVVREQPSDAWVVSSRQLVRWLAKLPRTLDGAEVAYISDVADRESTWKAVPAPGQDTQVLHAEFAELREEIASATRARVVWATVAFLLFAGTVWTTVAILTSDFVRP
ncbi:MAG: hypothetical protein JWR36_932 [Glaciihabitans sp.]|jgi:hypothetical protein|nr:hypothetical protein [Glaciihabitans sp.]